MFVCVFFFFKQKTAYEMRISDWSSDVCSSDLRQSFGAVGMKRTAAGRSVVWLALENDVPDFRMQGATQRSGWPRQSGADAGANGQKIGRASCRERVCKYV